jgi:hypothetical protein
MYSLTCGYFDTGIMDADIRISAFNNVVLEPAFQDKPSADEPKPVEKASHPRTPPGIELPDDVGSAQKALGPGDEKKDSAPADEPKKVKSPDSRCPGLKLPGSRSPMT